MPDQVIVIQGATSTVVSSSPVSPVIVTGGGASAYQIWLEQGNAGTEADFLESLEGAQGPQGATGATGATGAQGPKGDKGDPGDDAPVQTLSIDGNELTLSDGGGTVTLPGGADGNGVYSGSGTLSQPLTEVIGGGNDLTFQSIGTLSFGGDNLLFDANNATFTSNNDVSFLPTGNLIVEVEGDDGFTVATDNGLGVQYTEEYPDILTNDRSVPDVGTVNLLKQTPASYTNAAAPNNCIFYSTTDSKLSYKDPGGTVHSLY